MKVVALAGLLAWTGLLPGTSLQAATHEGFTQVAETAHFTHFARAGARTDAGRREKHLARVERLLEVRVDRHIDYYAYETPEEIQAVTGRYAAGYFFPSLGQVHATPEAEAHEIVHLVSHGLGDPGPFFNEGLAVALGNEGRLGGRPADRVARSVLSRISPEGLEARFASLQSSWEAVAAAGSFVAWLEDRHGMKKVAAFFRQCGRTGRPVAFETTFASPLPEALQAWARSLGVRPLPGEPSSKVAEARPSPTAMSLPVAGSPEMPAPEEAGSR
jgi:hypothetical protein